MLDLNLPDGSGLDVLRAAQSNHSVCPVVMISGAGSVPDAVEALKLGAADFLEKPVRMGQLSERLLQAIEQTDVLVRNDTKAACEQRSNTDRSTTIPPMVERLAKVVLTRNVVVRGLHA